MVVVIRNFKVIHNNLTYKYTNHLYQISFGRNASACLSNTFNGEFNNPEFEVIKFSDIMSMKLEPILPVGMCYNIYTILCVTNNLI